MGVRRAEFRRDGSLRAFHFLGLPCGDGDAVAVMCGLEEGGHAHDDWPADGAEDGWGQQTGFCRHSGLAS